MQRSVGSLVSLTHATSTVYIFAHMLCSVCVQVSRARFVQGKILGCAVYGNIFTTVCVNKAVLLCYHVLQLIQLPECSYQNVFNFAFMFAVVGCFVVFKVEVIMYIMDGKRTMMFERNCHKFLFPHFHN